MKRTGRILQAAALLAAIMIGLPPEAHAGGGTRYGCTILLEVHHDIVLNSNLVDIAYADLVSKRGRPYTLMPSKKNGWVAMSIDSLDDSPSFAAIMGGQVVGAQLVSPGAVLLTLSGKFAPNFIADQNTQYDVAGTLGIARGTPGTGALGGFSARVYEVQSGTPLYQLDWNVLSYDLRQNILWVGTNYAKPCTKDKRALQQIKRFIALQSGNRSTIPPGWRKPWSKR